MLVRWVAYDHPDSPATAFLELDRADIDRRSDRRPRQTAAAVAQLRARRYRRTRRLRIGRNDSQRSRAGPVVSPGRPTWRASIRRFHSSHCRGSGRHETRSSGPPTTRCTTRTTRCTSARSLRRRTAPTGSRSCCARDTLTTSMRFARMQMDVLSLPERELARSLAPAVRRNDASLAQSLTGWSGEMDGASTTGTVVEAARLRLTDHHNGRMPTLLETARSLGNPWAKSTPAAAVPWQSRRCGAGAQLAFEARRQLSRRRHAPR